MHIHIILWTKMSPVRWYQQSVSHMPIEYPTKAHTTNMTKEFRTLRILAKIFLVLHSFS